MEVYWIHLPDANIKTDGYVGITNNTKQRWVLHKKQTNHCHHFKNAILKYGDSLIWEEIFTGSEEGCAQLEEYFRPEPNIGWNIRSGGKYYKHSEEAKEKMSKAIKGRKQSEEHIEKIRSANTKIFVNIFNAKTDEVIALNVGLKKWMREMALESQYFYRALKGKRKTAYGYRIEKVLK